MFLDADGCKKIYVFYYNGSDAGTLKEQAYNSAYFDPEKDEVIMVEVNTKEDFVKKWNAMDDDVDEVYLYLHGEPGSLCFRDGNLTFDDDSGGYTFGDLHSKNVKKVFLFSCGGGTGEEGNNVAWMFAKLTGGEVVATTSGVSYTKVGGKYEARVEKSDFFKRSSGWGTYSYKKNKKGVSVPKRKWTTRKWAI